jgi:hypothetical protein
MPTVWQGWVVMVVFGLSILAGAVMLLPGVTSRSDFVSMTQAIAG